jgi:hypothetical protein
VQKGLGKLEGGGGQISNLQLKCALDFSLFSDEAQTVL